MRNQACLAIVAFAALSGCAGDNPENVPEYGQWEISTRLSSLTVDGQIVPPEQLPAQMQSLNDSEALCGEPMFIDREWQQKDINRKVHASCTIDAYNVSQTRVTGAGRCENIAPDVEFAPEFELRIQQSPQSYRMNLTMKGMASFPDGSRRYISASAIQEGKRSGGC